MKDYEKELIKLYNETFGTLEEVSRVVGISRNKAASILQKYDVVRNSKRVEVAKELYSTKKYSVTQLAVKVGMTRTTLAKYLKEDNDIEMFNPLKIYEYNEDYFKCIDSDEKAYWLGFICADGSIVEAKTYLTLEIGLQLSDREHLVKFLRALSFKESDIDKKIRVKNIRLKDKTYKSCSIVINSTRMCEDLIKLGVVPRKSLVMKFPNKISKQLIPAFLRGYIDGDGGYNIRYRRDGSKSVRLYIIATEEFLNEFYNFYKRQVSPTKLLSKKGTPVRQLEKGGSEAEYIIRNIYEGATVYLERKYNKINYLFK
ncbi:hypothetical protein [Clostridium celatum]|uniref:DOD-type homing endonuclease domain-containing protein n=1 Tax=Clostridium celatum DSM 1785 TaxID=545697 RepID=L1QGE5_9CLOT|nr:hypothetical protein [Clostridium celatum]EKY27011.1 hypothetical protein HMPREF0216_01614 [Clostridium celatum DSM 1785]MCE9654730.1 hypothetical protein [Clostridium celatum]